MQNVKDLTDWGDFGNFGRYEEVPVSEMGPEMKAAYDYTMQLRGLVPGPHKIWVANAILSRTIAPIGAGLVDLAVLIGWSTMVSMTLNICNVPANATGLDE